MKRFLVILLFPFALLADDYTFTNTASPWTISSNLPVGTWAVYCTVLTSDGTNATSVTNGFRTALVPSITLSSPANGATFDDSAVYTASPSAGTAPITNVSFIVDGAYAGAALASPWSFTNSPAAGAHTVYSTCYDTNGFTASSATVTFFMRSVTVPTTLSTNALKVRYRWKPRS